MQTFYTTRFLQQNDIFKNPPHIALSLPHLHSKHLSPFTEKTKGEMKKNI